MRNGRAHTHRGQEFAPQKTGYICADYSHLEEIPCSRAADHTFWVIREDHRHRHLEVAGQYEEIFAPEMMSPEPVYHFHVYRMWAQTNQCIFHAVGEEVAVADHFIASFSEMYQQVAGAALASKVVSHLPHIVAERIVKRALTEKSFKPQSAADGGQSAILTGPSVSKLLTVSFPIFSFLVRNSQNG